MEQITKHNRNASYSGLRAFFAAVLLIAVNGGCGNKPAAPTAATGRTAASERAASPLVENQADNEASPPTERAAANDQPAEKPQPAPQPIFRRSDTRPRHDDARLAAVGIRVFESQRLKLYTDIDSEIAATLPPLVDAAYPAWEAYFGKLPPDRERSEFQITGYLMADQGLFRDAGLIPDDLRPFENGRHRGAEFWMNEQRSGYYRRHLVIHEATHCFMEAIAGERYYEELPAWYWEGMAELFGTHRIDPAGRVHFRVMPGDRDAFIGLGRIAIVREAVERGDEKPVAGVARLRAADFIDTDAYAWSWALCKYLDTHPAYRKGFRGLGGLLTGSRFVRGWREFLTEHDDRLPVEWALFVEGIDYGYDIERAAVELREGKPLAGNAAAKADIRADRGWQSSAIKVEAARKYVVTAAGRFTLAQQPKPWESGAGGISFDYAGGRPLGLLLGRIHPPGKEMLPEFEIGRRREFVASASGTLYFRLNDSWSRLADNAGRVTVEVRKDNGREAESNHGESETRRGKEESAK